MTERKPKGKRNKKPHRGKNTYFPRVQNMLLKYPASTTGGEVEIVKGRQGRHNIIAPEDVEIVEVVDPKP